MSPTPQHEVPLRLLRERPELTTDLLALLDISVPEGCDVRSCGEERPEVVAAQRRVDSLVVYEDAGSPRLAVITEVQLRHDPGKYWVWPAYLADVRADLKCPTLLLVLCPDEKTAARCRQVIHLGHPNLILVPMVIGPNQIPLFTDPATAAQKIELALLSTLAYGASDQGPEVIDTFMAALDVIGDNEKAKHYADLVILAAEGYVKDLLEERMKSGTFTYQSDYAKSIEAKTEAKAALRILEKRGVEVPEADRAQMLACTDPAQGALWLDRALDATTIADVLTPDSEDGTRT
ncbi:hypothetical protein [Actinomadura parmotrematis]|uniref:DUF4365 domain-containing protein n=1 Tax=Actinomadura parmotrematis TaxID=2864039 RepID=A0ABS7FMF6_9ACTN|nr:hypothetical protein [Actinomadura parmotrematis]MBW8481558.1 hypothetical protein [Actinomadura parmotrematis]